MSDFPTLLASEMGVSRRTFLILARGISDDDTAAGVRHSPQDSPRMRRERCYERIRSLKERDPEKYNFLQRTPILEMIHPRAYEAVGTPERILQHESREAQAQYAPSHPVQLSQDELKNIGRHALPAVWAAVW